MKTLLLSVIGIACLCFLGSIQPIKVVDNTINQSQQAICKKCNGSGSIQSSEQCARCGGTGTGKGEWHFKSKAKIQFKESKTICTYCHGTGRKYSSIQCPQCKGTGRENVAGTVQKKTVQAGYSLWEKALAWFGKKPDSNTKPQRRFNSYPLISKYIKTMANPERDVRVLEWDSVRPEESAWIVKTRLEFKDKNGQFNEQGMEFIVENRAVKGARKVDWK